MQHVLWIHFKFLIKKKTAWSSNYSKRTWIGDQTHPSRKDSIWILSFMLFCYSIWTTRTIVLFPQLLIRKLIWETAYWHAINYWLITGTENRVNRYESSQSGNSSEKCYNARFNIWHCMTAFPYESIVYVFTSDRQKSKTGKKINKFR